MGKDSDETLPTFQRTQYRFAAHIRDPDNQPAPDDVEDRRMAIYRNLFFNNVTGYLANAFPVLRSLYDESGWTRLVRDYYARHESHGPQFYDIPAEFRAYLEQEREPRPEDPPFMLELAHFEWVEMKLQLADADIDWAAIQRQGDLLSGQPVLSPFVYNLEYRYPVHEITADYRPDTPPDTPTWLVVYRDRGDRVRFMKLNAVTAALLRLIEQDPGQTGRHCLRRIAQELGHPDEQPIVEAGVVMLDDFRDRDILLGCAIPAG